MALRTGNNKKPEMVNGFIGKPSVGSPLEIKVVPVIASKTTESKDSVIKSPTATAESLDSVNRLARAVADGSLESLDSVKTPLVPTLESLDSVPVAPVVTLESLDSAPKLIGDFTDSQRLALNDVYTYIKQDRLNNMTNKKAVKLVVVLFGVIKQLLAEVNPLKAQIKDLMRMNSPKVRAEREMREVALLDTIKAHDFIVANMQSGIDKKDRELGLIKDERNNILSLATDFAMELARLRKLLGLPPLLVPEFIILTETETVVVEKETVVTDLKVVVTESDSFGGHKQGKPTFYKNYFELVALAPKTRYGNIKFAWVEKKLKFDDKYKADTEEYMAWADMSLSYKTLESWWVFFNDGKVIHEGRPNEKFVKFDKVKFLSGTDAKWYQDNGFQN